MKTFTFILLVFLHLPLAASGGHTLYDRNRKNARFFKDREGCYARQLSCHIPKPSDEEKASEEPPPEPTREIGCGDGEIDEDW